VLKQFETFSDRIRLKGTVAMQVTLRRGLYLFSFLYMLNLSIGVSLANAASDDPIPKKSDVEVEDPQQETDSTEVPEQAQPYDVEAEMGTLNIEENPFDMDESDSDFSETTDSFYEQDEDEEETDTSVVSFNFLYYLLQKFKFSNSLGY